MSTKQSEGRDSKQGELRVGPRLRPANGYELDFQDADRYKLLQLREGPERLALQAQQLAKRRAVVLAVAMVAGTVFLVLVADALLQLELWWARWLGPLLVIAALVVAWWKLIRPAWRKRLTAREVVTWTQANGLPDGAGLLEAFELAAQEAKAGQSTNGSIDGRFGSQGFRSAALKSWLATHEIPDWSRYLDRPGWWRSVLLLTAVTIGFVVFGVTSANNFVLAARRLAAPGAALTWPQRDELRLIDLPATVAIDTNVQLSVFDARPPLPDNLRVWIRSADGRTRSLETTRLGDLAVAQLGRLRADVEVRASGGDDQEMPWQTIRVIAPPKINEFVFRVQPPPYSGKPGREMVAKQITVLAGSTVQLTGSFASRLAALTASFRTAATADQALHANDALGESNSWQAILQPDSKGFTVGGPSGQPTLVSSTTRWQFIVETEKNEVLKLPSVWSVAVRLDQPPQVDVAPPALAAVTATGALTVRGEVADDLGIAQIVVVASCGLRQVREVVSVTDPLLTGVEAELPLADLQIEAPDSSAASSIPIEVVIQATDTLGQVTESAPVPWLVTSSSDFLRNVAEEQAELSREMAMVLNRQRDSMLDVDGIVDDLRRNSQVTEQTASRLRQLARKQQGLRTELSTEEGLASRVAELSDRLTKNQLADAPLAQSLRDLGSQLGELASQAAVSAARNLDQAATAAQSAAAEQSRTSTPLESTLTNAQRDVREIVEELQALRSEIAARQVASDLADRLLRAAREQEVLERETGRLALAASAGESDASQVSALADRQGRLSRQLTGLTEQAAKLGAADVSTLDKEQLSRAAEQIESASISDLMRAAEERIRENEYAQASQLQSQLSTDLQNALEAAGLRNKSAATEIAQSGRVLADALERITALASRQTALAEAAEQRLTTDGDVANELRADQTQLRADTARFKDTVSEADSDLPQSLERILRLQQTAIDQFAEALSDAPNDVSSVRKAANELLSLADKIDRRKARMDVEQQRQQQFELVETLVRAVADQEKLTVMLGGTVARRPAPASLEQLSDVRLPEQIERLRQVAAMLDERPTFLWAMQNVQRNVKLMQAALPRERYEEARKLSERAERRLSIIAATLQDASEPGSDSAVPTDPEAADSESQDASQLPAAQLTAADLRLLRAIQSAIRDATQQAEDGEETQTLAEEQKQLLEQLRSLLKR